MTSYVGVITTAGAAKIAASVGGSALAISHIALGDGNGAEITPAVGNTHLVHEIWRGAVTAAGRDALNNAMWRFTTEVGEEAGPFTVREIGLFASDGTMVAIARHPLTVKADLIDGIATSLITEMVIPVAADANITVDFYNDDAGVGLWRLLRAPFVAANSATVTAPPGGPAAGDLYVVPAGATGAWAGQANKLVQWNGSVWTAFSAPIGTIVAAGGGWLQRTSTGWKNMAATIDQARAGDGADLWVTPPGLREALLDLIDHCLGGDPDFAASVAERYAPLSSPALTGVPTTTTPPDGDNTAQISPTSWVRTVIYGVVMDLIDHSLGGDPDFAATLSERLASIEARLDALEP